MSKAVTGTENIYFEMESKEATTYSGVYEDVVGESKTTSTLASQMTSEGSSNQSEATTQRLLHIMVALVVVSFLIATATLILVLLPMISRNIPSASTATNCTAGLQGKVINTMTT